MSRRGRSTRGEPHTGTDAEAHVTAMAIAGLRRRLKHPGTLEHPAVLRELRKLDEQITTLLEQADPVPGRHRSPTSTPPGHTASQQVSDAYGFDLKPDPLAATTATEFITALWQYKA